MNFLLCLLLAFFEISAFVLTKRTNARPEISNETILTIYRQVKNPKLKAVILNMYQNMKSDDETFYIRFECAFSSMQRYLRYAYETKQPNMNRINIINRKKRNGSRINFRLSARMRQLIYGNESEFDTHDQGRFNRYFRIWYVYTRLGNTSSSNCFRKSLNNFYKTKQNYRPGYKKVDQVYKSFAFNMARLFLLSGEIHSAKRHQMYKIFDSNPNKNFLQVLFEAWPEYFIHSDAVEYLNILQYCLKSNLAKFHSFKAINPRTNKSVVVPQSRACPRQNTSIFPSSMDADDEYY